MTIGLQQTEYKVTEDQTIVLVCTAVKSGSISGRTVTIDYQTLNGGAQGTVFYSLHVYTVMYCPMYTFIYCLQLQVTTCLSVETLT